MVTKAIQEAGRKRNYLPPALPDRAFDTLIRTGNFVPPRSGILEKDRRRTG
jgi:hypothetical protein